VVPMLFELAGSFVYAFDETVFAPVDAAAVDFFVVVVLTTERVVVPTAPLLELVVPRLEGVAVTLDCEDWPLADVSLFFLVVVPVIFELAGCFEDAFDETVFAPVDAAAVVFFVVVVLTTERVVVPTAPLLELVVPLLEGVAVTLDCEDWPLADVSLFFLVVVPMLFELAGCDEDSSA